MGLGHCWCHHGRSAALSFVFRSLVLDLFIDLIFTANYIDMLFIIIITFVNMCVYE